MCVTVHALFSQLFLETGFAFGYW